MAKRLDVRGSQVSYVDEVAFACSIGSWIVSSKDLQRRPISRCDINGKRDEMSFWIVALDQIPIRVRTRGIKIAQDRPYVFLCMARIGENLLAG